MKTARQFTYFAACATMLGMSVDQSFAAAAAAAGNAGGARATGTVGTTDMSGNTGMIGSTGTTGASPTGINSNSTSTTQTNTNGVTGTNGVSTGNTATTTNNGLAAGTNVGTQGSTNWNNENTYWQQNYNSRPYYNKGANYSTYQPAYQYGVTAYNQNGGRPYDQLDQTQLNNGWSQARSTSNLNWTQAQSATRDAYMRLYQQNHPNGLNSTTTTTTP